MTYPQLNRRMRMPLGFLLALAYLIFARPVEARFFAGLLIAFTGLLVRAWAVGHIEKNRELSVGGPYAFVRNPLYLGSFLLALGFAFATHWIFIPLVVGFFVLIYAPTIEQESATMLSLFPEQYPAYAANVPQFVPRITPWRPDSVTNPGTTVSGFSMSRYLRYSEWKAGLGFLAACTWLVLRLKLGL